MFSHNMEFAIFCRFMNFHLFGQVRFNNEENFLFSLYKIISTKILESAAGYIFDLTKIYF